MAACTVDGKGSVRILSNDFEALRAIETAANECASDAVKITANATAQHKDIQGPALTANPAEYTVAMVANNSIVPLLNDGLIRPLDDLVAKYGSQLAPNQLIKIDGKVMAIAFMGNGQHLFYRKDILEKAGITAVPASWEDVLADAKIIKDKGLLDYPLAAADKPGWDLAAEFVNLYLGTGANFFADGSAELAIDNDQGRKVLETMRAITTFENPDYLTYDANELNKVWDAGKVAFMNQWGSLAGAAIGDKANPDVAKNTGFAAAPTVGGGATPAAALWWDGFTIAKNISDEDAAASFQVMMHGISPDMMKANHDAAAWLITGYEPGPASEGVIANAKGGAKAYPMVPYMGLLHTALSSELADFIAGKEDADQALKDVKAAYDAAAKEGGFLK